MTYVEWLRVRGAVKWTAIVLGILFVCAIGLRIYFFSRGDMLSFVNDMRTDRGSTVSSSVLPDGTKQIVVDNPKDKVHIVIDDMGYAGQHIEVTEPKGSHSENEDVVFGSVNVTHTNNGADRVIVIDTNRPEPFIFYAAIACAVALIIATVLAAPFARENEGHLEIALTKPVPRITLAAATIGVDFAGIVMAWAATVVFLIACRLLFQAPNFSFDANDLVGTGLGILGCFAWYAMIVAANSSMKRASGIVQGLAWPFALVVVALGNADLGQMPIFQALHAVAHTLSYIIPLNYLHFGPAYTVNGTPEGSAAFKASIEAPALAALTIGYSILAIAQWRRVEA